MTILPFNSPYAHGLVRTAVATPRVRVADPRHNGRQVIDLAQTAAEDHACLVVFPELALSGYSNEDLFFQDALLDGVLAALAELAQQTRELKPILVVGAPLRSHNALFNCAVVLHRGQVQGVIPKSYLPNYREFYEKRHFAPARAALQRSIQLHGLDVPFGPDLIFTVPRIGMTLHVEICEDLWVPIPPSTEAALAGANVLVNLSASNVTIGKPEYRRLLCAAQSAKCVAPTSTVARVPASRPPTWRGTGTPSSTRTAISLRKASATRQHRASSQPTSTWTACGRSACV
jgi:NAD+ synthase (glutamine-hydrolysing)